MFGAKPNYEVLFLPGKNMSTQWMLENLGHLSDLMSAYRNSLNTSLTDMPVPLTSEQHAFTGTAHERLAIASRFSPT